MHVHLCDSSAAMHPWVRLWWIILFISEPVAVKCEKNERFPPSGGCNPLASSFGHVVLIGRPVLTSPCRAFHALITPSAFLTLVPQKRVSGDFCRFLTF